MRNLVRLVAVMTLVGVVAGGCGKSNSGSAGSGTGTGTADTAAPVKLSGTTNNHGTKDFTGKGGSADVTVELDDFYMAPTFIKAKAGQTLSITIKNDGKNAHTFTTGGGVDEQVNPGKSAKASLTAPASGVLVYYCRFHQGQGMQGAVYLKDGASSETPSTAGSGGSGY
ncbi:MAG: hypothetical protein QOK43_2722 [Acidimicrobiaceae bacterium]|jgi:plastocyanin|nr:hypothetical protein [Acidimicrobiaceae bacterium]MDQ1445100.1 hypothetical protein [Acidimicrobiaceae bacterium]